MSMSSINTEKLMNWVSRFQSEHGNTCDRDVADVNEDNTGSGYKQPFRLVDVNQRTIVKAESFQTKYATLSYVWGKSQEEYRLVQRASYWSDEEGGIIQNVSSYQILAMTFLTQSQMHWKLCQLIQVDYIEIQHSGSLEISPRPSKATP